MIEEYAVIRYNKNNEIYFSSIGLIPEFADFYGAKDIDIILIDENNYHIEMKELIKPHQRFIMDKIKGGII